MIDTRVAQANERTLLAWVRTGLALMAFGFVIERLAVWFGTEGGVENETPTLVIGGAIVGLGALCEIVGAIRFIRVKRALLANREPPSGIAAPVLLALCMAVAGVALLVYLLAT